MSSFALLIDGERYRGWKTIRVTRGLKRAAADFALSVSSREPWPVFPGAACEIYVDNDRLLTGWIDAFRPGCSASDHTIELSGRSKTCDFIDSGVTMDGGQLTGMTLRQIAEVLAQPFGIGVIAEVEGEPVPEVQVQQGETCFALTERLARLQELLITDDADGRLVLTRASSRRADTALVFGVNVKEASADADDAGRFSHYIVKAQRPGNRTNDNAWAEGSDPWDDYSARGANADDRRAAWRRRMQLLRQDARRRTRDLDDGNDAWVGEPGSGSDRALDRGAHVITQVTGTARDFGITRYRPKVIVAEAQADDEHAAQRADWELRRRIAEALSATITVNGWRQDSGTLWTTNLMADVNVPWLGIERDMLIGEVEYSIDQGGEITRLSLVLPDALLPEPRREAKQRVARKAAARGRPGGKAKTDIWADVIGPGGR